MMEAVQEDSLGEGQDGSHRLAGDLRLVDAHDLPRRIEGCLGNAERETGYGAEEHPHPHVKLLRAESQQNKPASRTGRAFVISSLNPTPRAAGKGKARPGLPTMAMKLNLTTF